MQRDYYSASIAIFLNTPTEELLGILASNNQFTLEQTQKNAWLEQIKLLRAALTAVDGSIYFEFSIPRMGKRIDVLLLIASVIFIIEFKIGDKTFAAHAIDQVLDYALDLKNFHEPSHTKTIAPILVATAATEGSPLTALATYEDNILLPIKSTADQLANVITAVLQCAEGDAIDRTPWENGRYCPTPTIVEAAMALYSGHSVNEISRSDAGAINLTHTSHALSEIIQTSKAASRKSICFVTGVPGAGKTLVGLDIATKNINTASDNYSVFLSGNGPLVKILLEALARDKVHHERQHGRKIKKGVAMSEVKMFIQNIHHFRDECLLDPKPPIEHVALFDEAQRAWNLEQTSTFMKQKKNKPHFRQSEPEFLISCLDRHQDWAVIVCLVGGGQEINTGEAGISEWIASLNRSFPDWHIHISSRLTDTEYAAGNILNELKSRPNVTKNDNLHLAVSMRSFRAEHVSLLVKQLLDLEPDHARETFKKVHNKYPMAITRDLQTAKTWLKTHARGSERYGIVASSHAERLKPHAIDVKSPMNPIHWFLHGKDDVRSSYYLEHVATEFAVQGLELDWACVTWDADFRYHPQGWKHRSFVGNGWNQINKPANQTYLKNAYRVLLTRARQGMIIFIPPGDPTDPTRKPEFYDPTFHYLRTLGFPTI